MTNLHRLKTLLIAGIVAILALSPAYAKEKFKVITTFTVIADMAKNVAGDAAEVSSITKPGAEIHEYQPTPGDIKRAQGGTAYPREWSEPGAMVRPILSAPFRRTGSRRLYRRQTDGHYRRPV